MPVLPVNKVVDKKRIVGKGRRRRRRRRWRRRRRRTLYR
jgi:hypothetical protein